MTPNTLMPFQLRDSRITALISHQINVKRMGMIQVVEHLKSILKTVFLNYLIIYNLKG